MREVKIKNTLLGILVGTSLLSMSGCTEKGIESGKQHTKSSEEKNMSDEEKEIIEGRKQTYKDAGFTDEQITMLLMDEKEFAEFAMSNPEKIEGDYEFYINKYLDTMNIYYSSKYEDITGNIDDEIDWSKAPDFNKEISEKDLDKILYDYADGKGYLEMQRYNEMTPEERKEEWVIKQRDKIASERMSEGMGNKELSRITTEVLPQRKEELLNNKNITLISKENLEKLIKENDELYKDIMNKRINSLKEKKEINCDEEINKLMNNINELMDKDFLIIGSNPFETDPDSLGNIVTIKGRGFGTNSSYNVDITKPFVINLSNLEESLVGGINEQNHLIELTNSEYEDIRKEANEEINESIETLTNRKENGSFFNETDFNETIKKVIQDRLDKLNEK